MPTRGIDPEALLAGKGGAGAYLNFTNHALAENRNGLIVDGHTTQATDRAVPAAVKVTDGYEVSLRHRMQAAVSK